MTDTTAKTTKTGSAQWDPILKSLGVPTSAQNYGVLNAWSQAEGHNNYNNPFNTTLKNSGSVGSFNSVGVQKYKDYNSGVQATVDTLRNTKGVGYDKIIAGLKSNNPNAAIQAIVNSSWSGSSHYGAGKGGDYRNSSLWKVYSGGKAGPPPINSSSDSTGVSSSKNRKKLFNTQAPAPAAPTTGLSGSSPSLNLSQLNPSGNIGSSTSGSSVGMRVF